MAKYSDNPVTGASIGEYLAAQDDFGLELRTYAKARSLGLTVTHGGTYEDPVTKKIRQYDIRAFRVSDDRRIDIAIECKSLRTSYPLVLSRIPRIPAESFHQVIWSYEPSMSRYSVVSAGPPAKSLSIRRTSQFYPVGEPVGKSTVQVGRTEGGGFIAGDSEVYDKWTQALGSAAELVQCAAYRHNESPVGQMSSVVLAALVVASGTLWVADYSECGQLRRQPYNVDQAELFVGREYWQPAGIDYVISHLHVCTPAGIEELLTKIAGDESYWDSLFPHAEMLDAASES